MTNKALERLKYHVTGAIERGEGKPILAQVKPKCDMTKDCAQDVTHIDSRGFVYCECHGKRRKAGGDKCRKLRPSEIKRLELGQKIGRY